MHSNYRNSKNYNANDLQAPTIERSLSTLHGEIFTENTL